MSDPTESVPSLHDQHSDANVGYDVPADAVDSLNAWYDAQKMTDADVDRAFVEMMEQRDADELAANRAMLEAFNVALDAIRDGLIADVA